MQDRAEKGLLSGGSEEAGAVWESIFNCSFFQCASANPCFILPSRSFVPLKNALVNGCLDCIVHYSAESGTPYPFRIRVDTAQSSSCQRVACLESPDPSRRRWRLIHNGQKRADLPCFCCCARFSDGNWAVFSMLAAARQGCDRPPRLCST
jgi:hypothetical protein